MSDVLVKEYVVVHSVKVLFDDTWTEEDADQFVKEWLVPAKYPHGWNTNGIDVQKHKTAIASETLLKA